MRTVLLLLILALTGCSGSRTYLPRHAFTKAVDTVSIAHPYEQEKRGVKAITSFEIIISPSLLVEGAFGVWPDVSRKSDGTLLYGKAIIAPVKDSSGSLLLPMTPACEVIARVFYEASLEELETARSLAFNRDGGWAYNHAGYDLPSVFMPDGVKRDEGVLYYDPKQFDEDEEYQKKFFETYGTTLKEHRIIRQRNFTEQELIAKEDIFEVKVGTPEWEAYKKMLLSAFTRVYKMPGGEYRIGFLVGDDFREAATEIPDSKAALRLFKQFGLPLGLIGASFAGPAAIIPAANFAGDVTSSVIDDKWWQSYHARANTMRHDLVPVIKLVQESCKKIKKQ